MEDRYHTIRRNLEVVQERIVRAAKNAGRQPDEIRLVVVSKGQPIEVVEAAVEAGVTLFGENYPEEALEKISKVPAHVQWHMIGHLQSRKIPLVVEYFDYFHSLDRISLAEKLNQRLKQQGSTLPVLLEVNIGGEASKFGWNVVDQQGRGSFFADIEKIVGLDALQVQGLMTMPPYSLDPAQSRVWFRQMRKLREELHRTFPNQNWEELSMGTSHDFEMAIEEGATFVRIGEAILGPRQTKTT